MGDMLYSMALGADGDVMCKFVTDDHIQCDNELFTRGDHLDQFGTWRFWMDASICAGLVLVAGLMSGLTMGLMSMDKLNLQIIKNSGEEKERKHAARILPLVEKHHLLLVTLLLTNAAAAEALPIFLDRLVPSYVAIAMSVTLVLLFGEIIPQAACTRYGLQIGSYLSWFVWCLIGALFVVAWPISKLLDAILGTEHGTFFRRAELKELVHLHAEDVHDGQGEPLTDDEVRIIKGAIDMREKTVGQCLTPMDKVFAIDVDDRLERPLLQKIVESGHDRIPVYHNNREHLIGFVLVKDILLPSIDHDPTASPLSVRSIRLYRMPIVDANMPLYDLLHQFQTGRSHMAAVLDPKDHISPLGIITLEDVMEELLQEEILDEDDLRRKHDKAQYADLMRDMRLARAFMPRPSIVGGVDRRVSMSGSVQAQQLSHGQIQSGPAPGKRRESSAVYARMQGSQKPQSALGSSAGPRPNGSLTDKKRMSVPIPAASPASLSLAVPNDLDGINEKTPLKTASGTPSK